jgi:hypothetical protein
MTSPVNTWDAGVSRGGMVHPVPASSTNSSDRTHMFLRFMNWFPFIYWRISFPSFRFPETRFVGKQIMSSTLTLSEPAIRHGLVKIL